MTEQEKREKVIKGLEDFIQAYRDAFNDGADGPLEDALALLKAIEPMVMTLEEVVGSIVLGRDVTLWFEFKDSIIELNAKDIVYSDYLCNDDIPTLYEPNLEWRDNGYRDGVIVAEYNDVFRCWTSSPTDEQREAIPWN